MRRRGACRCQSITLPIEKDHQPLTQSIMFPLFIRRINYFHTHLCESGTAHDNEGITILSAWTVCLQQGQDFFICVKKHHFCIKYKKNTDLLKAYRIVFLIEYSKLGTRLDSTRLDSTFSSRVYPRNRHARVESTSRIDSTDSCEPSRVLRV